MEIDLFSLPRRAASALPPFPEFLSKLAAAEPVYAIKKALRWAFFVALGEVNPPSSSDGGFTRLAALFFFIVWLLLSHCIQRVVLSSTARFYPDSME
ncbi:MAG: hypothetical protein IKB34_07415 [Clostridia bacterium]|nr:hypothetical protein [Clostridia bacterium]